MTIVLDLAILVATAVTIIAMAAMAVAAWRG